MVSKLLKLLLSLIVMSMKLSIKRHHKNYDYTLTQSARRFVSHMKYPCSPKEIPQQFLKIKPVYQNRNIFKGLHRKAPIVIALNNFNEPGVIYQCSNKEMYGFVIRVDTVKRHIANLLCHRHTVLVSMSGCKISLYGAWAAFKWFGDSVVL